MAAKGEAYVIRSRGGELSYASRIILILKAMMTAQTSFGIDAAHPAENGVRRPRYDHGKEIEVAA